MDMKTIFFGFFFTCQLLLLTTCTHQPAASETPEASDPFGHVTDAAVKRVLGAAIERAGGLAQWNRLAAMRFTKDYTLLLESGEIENAALQRHHYTLGEEPTVEIEWEMDGQQHTIQYQQDQYQKLVNGKIDTSAAQQTLVNTVLSATFVMSIPFKLLDKGVALSYGGLDTLANGQVVEVIQASYNPSTHSAHSTPDIWHHYYDAEDFTFHAYMVQHADHYSYVENQSFAAVDGFLLPKIRKSYRVDEERNLLYLRAEYAYGDYELAFGVE